MKKSIRTGAPSAREILPSYFACIVRALRAMGNMTPTLFCSATVVTASATWVAWTRPLWPFQRANGTANGAWPKGRTIKTKRSFNFQIITITSKEMPKKRGDVRKSDDLLSERTEEDGNQIEEKNH